MATLDVLRFPDERLRKIATPIEKITSDLEHIIEDMFETMYLEEGIGLAATQVNIHKRLVVVDTSENRDQPMVFINPELEDCLNMPRVLLSRHPR